MIRRPPRSTLSSSSAASDVYKRQVSTQSTGARHSTRMAASGLFGGKSAEQKAMETAAAGLEMKMMADHVNRMMEQCFKKCVHDFQEGELHVGEMSCLDRCVFKYSATQQKVVKRLQEFQKEQQAQMEQQAQLAQTQAEVEQQLQGYFGGGGQS
eukprot:TRINITY_DN731_c0_g1_i1.p1 TRINITY_DN731_c0_g1~~TRINITY_DN731_c0_g1_i1.p1  ORF type:complete len:154 (-),score=66.43 TRINITY_DN731_c0_g1_i1:351-812(-)